MKSNVKIQTNVVCVKNGNETLSQAELGSRLGYFELMGYRSVNRVLFSMGAYGLTPRQQWEKEGPRGRKNRLLDSLWNHGEGLSPMRAERVNNPFESPDAPDEPTEIPGGPSAEDEHSDGVLLPVPEERNDHLLPTLPDDCASETTFDEQEQFVAASPEHDLLVVAPPGTGKTHALVERLAYLVEKGICQNPLEEILVLSYTRSAVGELRTRLQLKQDAVRNDRLNYCRIRTFDAFATELLKKDLPYESLVVGHNPRIEQLSKGLREGTLPAAIGEISRIRHFLVDEVQDLNGARAEMVLVLAGIISKSGGSISFLGDPAQAIYDFEVNDEDANTRLGSIEFLQKIIAGEYSDGPPVRIEFHNYRRFETPQMLQFVTRAREAMGIDGLYPDGVQLDELLRELGPQTNLDSLCDHLTDGTTAVLTRNNLEAFQLWDWCCTHGIDASLWRGAKGAYWPGWISLLMLGFQNDSMSLETAEKRWDKWIKNETNMPFRDAVKYLRETGLMDDNEDYISVSQVRGRITNSAPSGTQKSDVGRLVISTIHRSKGLEFDEVFMLAPANGKMSKADETRLIYVAATRARRSLKVLARDSRVLHRGAKNQPGKLVTDNFHLFKYPKYPHIGLLVDGIDAVDPDSIQNLSESCEAQRSLWKDCYGRSRNAKISDGELSVGGVVVGGVSRKLQADIKQITGLRGISNDTLEGIRIVDLATVPTEASSHPKLGFSGLVLVPVTTGIGVC